MKRILGIAGATVAISIGIFSLYAFVPGARALHASGSMQPIADIILGTPHAQPVRMLAFGDLMLDRAVRTDIDAEGAGYPFEYLKDWFPGHDIVVANAEGVFTHNPSVSVAATSTLRFTFDPQSLATLKQLGFTTLSQANNHALDFGLAGLRESQGLIQDAGIGPFGDPMNTNPGPLEQTINGKKIAFIGYHQFTENGDSHVLAAIEKARADGAFVIVYPHWGVEYDQGVQATQSREAHRFIDAGADLILGSHPHVIEPIEAYDGKLIFYSLGNFIFDQSMSGPTSIGLAVAITLDDSSAAYALRPFTISHAQAIPGDQNLQQQVFAMLAATSIAADDSLVQQIRSGTIMMKR